MADEDDIILSELDDEDLVAQMFDDLYDGLKEEIEEGVHILLDRGWTPYDVLTRALVAGMTIVGNDFRDGILFVPEVLLAANAMKAGMAILKPLLREFRIAPWSVETNHGELKNVILTCNPQTKRLMVQMVLRSKESLDRIRRMWQDHSDSSFHQVEVFSVNLQPIRSSKLVGRDELPISECQRFTVGYGSTQVFYGPQSFIQTNHQIASQLYDKVAEIVLRHGVSSLLDMYCGAGALSLVVASRHRTQQQHLDHTAGGEALQIAGFDVSRDAVECANAAATAMELSNVSYSCLDAQAGLSTLVHSCDTIICNPPRRGLDQEAITMLMQLNPELVIYSSCNPVTLKRDMELLANRFEFTEGYPFDMFPFSSHVELLTVGARRKK